jgi:hypothetical protein
MKSRCRDVRDHVARVNEMRDAYKVLAWRSEGRDHLEDFVLAGQY